MAAEIKDWLAACAFAQVSLTPTALITLLAPTGIDSGAVLGVGDYRFQLTAPVSPDQTFPRLSAFVNVPVFIGGFFEDPSTLRVRCYDGLGQPVHALAFSIELHKYPADRGPVPAVPPAPVATVLPAAVLAWGNNSLNAAADTRFLCPFFDDAVATVPEFRMLVPRAGVISNLFVLQNDPAGNGSDIIYTLFHGVGDSAGVATALQATLASTDSSVSNTDPDDAVTVALGDSVSLQANKPNALGTSPNNIVVTAQLA